MWKSRKNGQWRKFLVESETKEKIVDQLNNWNPRTKNGKPLSCASHNIISSKVWPKNEKNKRLKKKKKLRAPY
jgi:hypothetical protein